MIELALLIQRIKRKFTKGDPLIMIFKFNSMITFGTKLNTTALLLVALTFFAFNLKAQDTWNDLAKTPPMGWNSWNTFGLEINENLVMGIADVFVELGLQDAGYEYIVIDDGWQVTRDIHGNIIADSTKFPSGIKALADYIHSKGLKIGIYSDAGTKTCGNFPGSRGYEYQDARQYAAWGIDYLKYDWCHTGQQSAKDSYGLMSEALRKADRPMLFSMCEWGFNEPWKWAEGVAHMWRTTLDIADCWDCSQIVHSENGVQIENFMGFTKILDLQSGLEVYAGLGHWNDPDMLEVGNDSLSFEENKAHFSLWALLAAPLMLGNDVRTMTLEVQEIITNSEVIDINQDALGKQGVKIRDDGDFEVWSKQLNDGGRAVIFFNRSESATEMSFNWTEIGYNNKLKLSVRDLWQKKDLGKFTKKFTSQVPSHGVVMVRVGL